MPRHQPHPPNATKAKSVLLRLLQSQRRHRRTRRVCCPEKGVPLAEEPQLTSAVSVLQNLAIVVDDRLARCARRAADLTFAPPRPGEARHQRHRRSRPDRPSSIVAPIRILLKRKIGDGAAVDLTIVRPAAAAPPRRLAQVELIAARPSRAREIRANRITVLNAVVEPWCCRKPPRSSRAAPAHR